VKLDVRAARLVALALLASCGAPPPTHPAKPEVVVADDQHAPVEDDSAVTADSPAPAPPRHTDVDACVQGLRNGDGLANTDGRQAYDTGLAAERGGDLTTARKSFYQLIQNSPRSGLIPLAYLAFGEIFRAEAASDPSKWPLAEQSYNEVAKYPPPSNTAYGYAMLRLGDVHVETKDGQRALNDYKKAVEAGQQHSSLPCSQAIADSAKEKLATLYAEYGDPAKAYVFFKTIAGEDAGQRMLEQLVARYREKNQSAEACTAARSTPKLANLEREVCKKP
jgi:hypothetical protein